MIPSISRFLASRLKGRAWRRLNWKRYDARFDEAIATFVTGKGITDAKVVRDYRRKLIKAFIRDNWYPDEYFCFHYDRLSEKGRKSFVSNREGNEFWSWANTREIYLLTCDKGKTYEAFRPFFHREALSVTRQDADTVSFAAFVSRHPRFIAKPLGGNLGRGVRIVDAPAGMDSKALLADLCAQYTDGFIAEEMIRQCETMAAPHPSSVNTVRLTTVRLADGSIYVIHRPFVRFGQGGNCVDNGGSGGLLCSIDYETGIVTGVMDEGGNRYVVHPDTGIALVGFKVPRWEEAKATAVMLAQVLPDLNYCGWDLALTEQGWVMVEANGKGLFIGFQMPTQTGFRNEFEEIKRRSGYQR